ncbi:TonB-dependent receptor [Siphonobacter sp. SORGH_AS_0500]|uniref:SusC/RagA family TonB-linked outer membrane protein n=1 Tax=Siphonobacter sp. SORGH_AS_0500 TaxID=1864824 RepID=UPI00285CFD3E|nr:TonB-dependent receptor [Siphonobacter sp. SORGH_AS_0500]MDR6197329.1 TonB-linked SusC/RagA family outer membrane protein [Siphonobacter sp. SORGH_AS_0500]
MRLLIPFLVLWFVPLLGSGQELFLKGRVTAEGGQGLPGVNVVVKGTNIGTSTDAEGRYQLRLPSGDGTLLFSSIGYIKQEVPLANRTSIDVTLLPDAQALNEVVVVGYGEQSRKSLSTAVSSVSSKQLKDIPVANPAQALAAQVSGVNITQTGGQPGAAPVIRIRGVGSLGAGNSPLYVVDGYPLASADNFNQINPGDIQSIEVLKDAAAAAIYGSRGGNGVILVTTKRGEVGKPRIMFNTFAGVQNLARKVSLMNNQQFIDFSRESAINAGLKYYAFYDNPPSDLPETDWQEAIYRQAFMTQQELSASGGSEKVRYHVSGSYLKQEGILKATGFERFTLRANLEMQLSKRVRAGVVLAPSLTNTQYQTVAGTNDASIIAVGTDPIAAALVMPSLFPERLPNGDYANTNNYPLTQGANSISPNFRGPTVQFDQYRDRGSSPRFLANSFIEWELVPDLTAKTSFGVEYNTDTRNQFVPATMPSNTAPTANLSNPLVNNIAAAKRMNTSSNWLWENTLHYRKTFHEDHSFDVLAGYTVQSATGSGNVITGVNGSFINDLITNVSGAGTTTATNTYSQNNLVSYLGRVNYSYQDRYLFSAAIRRDGSSRFGANNRYATFPSVSAAWRLSEENFMKSVTLISDLKIRGSYGLTGNNNIGNYASQSYATQANYSFGSGAGARTYGYAATNIANASLTWETNQQTDLGLELGLWQDRIYLTADVYQRLTTGLLNNRNVPALVGIAGSVLENIGKISNKGLELSITSRNVSGKSLSWTTNGNISFNQNRVLSLVNDKPIYYSAGGFTNYAIVEPGKALGEFYGYRQIGVFKDQAEVDAGAVWASGGSKPGDIKYEDINGDGRINASDLTYLGNPLPKFIYGLTNTLTWKGFDLNVILQGSQGNKIWAQWLRSGYFFNGNANTITDVANRWRSASDPGNGWQPRATNTPSGGANNPSSRYVYDASFLRIRTVSLGYTLPSLLTKRWKIEQARLYMSGHNLYTFTKYIGYNPEANDNGNTTAPTYGYDSASYPLARTITVGINLGF